MHNDRILLYYMYFNKLTGEYTILLALVPPLILECFLWMCMNDRVGWLDILSIISSMFSLIEPLDHFVSRSGWYGVAYCELYCRALLNVGFLVAFYILEDVKFAIADTWQQSMDAYFVVIIGLSTILELGFGSCYISKIKVLKDSQSTDEFPTFNFIDDDILDQSDDGKAAVSMARLRPPSNFVSEPGDDAVNTV